MDFVIADTPEQAAFRKEVSAWLDENVPPGMQARPDSDNVTMEQFQFGREFQRKLGAKGWFAPMWPAEYGGGGLSRDHAQVIEEEVAKRNLPKAYNLGLSLCAPAVLVWGTEEQKQRILPPILGGEILSWQLMSEPSAGSDLAGVKTTATRDGDDYILNGQKLWVGSTPPALRPAEGPQTPHHVDYLYVFAVTDQTAPRHQNLGAFFIPADLPGITIHPLDLVCHYKNEVFFENVRVSRDMMIGGETDGWRVANATLDVEHGGHGSVTGFGGLVYKLIDYCKKTERNGRPLSKDPEIASALADLYVSAQVGRLFNLRVYWLANTHEHMSYEGAQNFLYTKTFEPTLARKILEIVGPTALLDDPDLAPLRGAFEVQQRYSLSTHAGGTAEIQRVVVSRRIGGPRRPEAMGAM